MKIVLNYRDEEFNKKKTSVEIDFINQRMTNEFSRLVGDITTLQMLNRSIEEGNKEKGAIITDPDLSLAERREKLKAHEETMEEIRDEYRKRCNSDIPRRRFDLIQLILKANHSTDEMLTSEEFWENQVDPGEINEFMAA